MKQELKDVIDELNECFEYATTKITPKELTNNAQDNLCTHRLDFLLGVVSSLYIEAFKLNNVKYEIGIKNDKP